MQTNKQKCANGQNVIKFKGVTQLTNAQFFFSNKVREEKTNTEKKGRKMNEIFN